MVSQKGRRPNDPDFKTEAVRVVLENPDKTKAQIARELGIDLKALYSWLQEHRKHHADTFPGNGKSTDEVASTRAALKQELQLALKATSTHS